MPPAAILFDLDDTILTSGDPRDLWRSCIAAHRHRFDGVDAEALHAEILQVAALFWSDAERHRRGRLRIKQARRGIVATAAENLGYDDSAAAVALADAYHERRETDVVPFAGALETLQLLQERGIPMALVTNGGPETQRYKIEKYDLVRFFEVVAVEGEVGVGKPDPRVYHHVLGELGVGPRDAWIVGDNLKWEVEAPQQLGMFAIWHDHRGTGLPKDSPVRPNRIVQRIREVVGLL